MRLWTRRVLGRRPRAVAASHPPLQACAWRTAVQGTPRECVLTLKHLESRGQDYISVQELHLLPTSPHFFLDGASVSESSYGFRNFSFFKLALLSLLPPDTAFGTMGIWSCSPSPEFLSREKGNIRGERQGREEGRREGKMEPRWRWR